MKVREIKDIEKTKCPINFIFGSSRYWGSYYYETKSRPVTFIQLFCKGMTPAIMAETLDHEYFHYCLAKIKKEIKKRWNSIQEHWVIDRMIYAGHDWY